MLITFPLGAVIERPWPPFNHSAPSLGKQDADSNNDLNNKYFTNFRKESEDQKEHIKKPLFKSVFNSFSH